MKEHELQILFDKNHSVTLEDVETAARFRHQMVSRMIATARQETDRLEHHLLEMPLSVIVYQWVIVRLKSRPWRLLVPASLLLSLLFQTLLPRFNLFQLLAR